jgi:hypothetical protein
MMPSRQDRLFELEPGPHCGVCSVAEECGAARTEFACPLHWSTPGYGGQNPLHPDRPDAAEHIASLHGFNLKAYRARPLKIPELPGYLPQFRWSEALAGHLHGPVYAVRPKAILNGERIRTAAEVREHLGLGSKQLLVLLLFDDDELLERFYDPRVAAQLAEAGYDLVVSASYSIWWPRPRLHQLYNLTRSLALCIALQTLGAPAVPRIDWVFAHDVRRWAAWINENPCVELVAIDAQTSKQAGGSSWRQLLVGIEEFDRQTNGRLRYLINGPASEGRWAEIYGVLAPERVTFTDARLHEAKPPSEQERLQFGQPGRKRIDWGRCYPARVERRQAEISAAQRRAHLAAA